MLVEDACRRGAVQMQRVLPSDIFSKWTGQSEKALRSIFVEGWESRSGVQTVIFFDELDCLLPRRGDAQAEVGSTRLLSELLLLLNENQSRRGNHVIVIGATNKMEGIDSALLRRFERKVAVELPSSIDRQAMLDAHLRGIEHELDEDALADAVAKTEGWSGDAIRNLCKEACMIPLREAMEKCSEDNHEIALRPVSPKDMSAAFQSLSHV